MNCRRLNPFIAWGLGLLMVVPMMLPAQAQGVCSWPLLLDDDSLNFAFPDQGSTYWMTRFVSLPTSRLVIRGEYPQARYFSFHVYDDAQRPVDAIADFEIRPDHGTNPFATGKTGSGRGRYTVFVEFTARPKRREPNTIYAGAMDDGMPNPGGFMIYRVYVPTDPRDPAGSAPVPDVTLELPGGYGKLDFERCDPFPPSEPGRTVNDHTRASSFPNEIPRFLPFPGTQEEPRFRRFYGPDREIRERFPSNPVTDAIPYINQGFLQNEHIAYLYVRISRDWGDVFVFRAKAPTFPDTRAGDSLAGGNQVRYWSLCQNELGTQRVVACSADYETVIGDDGYFTFVVSDPDDRPKKADARHAVNWLPWGGIYYDGVVIYRHMLPDRTFTEAIQNVDEGVDPVKVMGEYFPDASYCSAETFDAEGWRGCLGLERFGRGQSKQVE